MAPGFTASLVSLVCATALLSSGVSGSIEPPKGVPLSKAEQYSVSSDSFACLAGGGSISFSRMNDGYCDCADGSDEPGTAACAHLDGAQFYCRNVGHRGKYIPSSHVMDSVCDCCDGSDEASVTGCANTCEEDAALSYAAAASRIKILEAGARAKAKYVEAYVAQQAAALEEEKVLTADLDAARAKVSEMEAEEATLLADSAAERGQYVKAAVLRILNRFPIVGQGFEATVATLGLDELRELLVRYARKVDKRGRNLMGLLANENLDEEVDNLLDDEEGDEYTPYEDDYDHEHDWENNGHDYMDDDVHAYDEYGDNSYGDEYGGESMETYGDYQHDSADDYGALGHDEYSSGGDYGEVFDSGHDTWATDEGEASDLGDSSSGEEGVGAEADASAVEPRNENENNGGVEDRSEVESSVNDEDEIPQMEFVGDEDYLDSEYDSSQSNTDMAASSNELGAESAAATPNDAEADPLGTAASEPLELPALTAHRRALAEQRKTVKDLDRKLTKLQSGSKENLYGPQGEYWLLKGKCLKLDHQQYTYEVCPYGDAHQRDKGNAYGGSRLGKWKRTADAPSSVLEAAADYEALTVGSGVGGGGQPQAFIFENGDYCSATSQSRTATVVLTCGEDDKLLSVEEPSVCEYAFVMATPAACELAHGQSLQLDLPDHDEDAAVSQSEVGSEPTTEESSSVREESTRSEF